MRAFTIVNTVLFAAACMCVAPMAVPASDDYVARRPADNDALPSAPPDMQLRYGDHVSQFVNVRVPNSVKFGPGPYPVVVVIHGGCYVQAYASVKNTAGLADALRGEGYVTVNVEYRRVDQAGGGWPGTLTDIAHVMDSLKDWATDIKADTSRIATLGHSAGGHLALWALARPAIPANTPLYRESPQMVRGGISLGGPADLLNGRENFAKICGVDGITPLLGGPSLMAWNARTASPAELLPFEGQQYLYAGDRDAIVPEAENEAYAQRTNQAGSHLVVRNFTDIGHHDYLNPGNKQTFQALLSDLGAALTN